MHSIAIKTETFRVSHHSNSNIQIVQRSIFESKSSRNRTMFIQTIAVFCLATLSCARVIENYQVPQEFNTEYLQYPVDYQSIEDVAPIRVRRQIYGSVTPGNPGATATIGARGNIFKQNGHSVDAHAQVSRTYKPAGPTSIGGGIDYQGPRGGLSASANNVRHLGTDVNVGGNANVWQSRDGRSSVDVNGGYNRHYGGPGGTGKGNYNAGAQFSHRF